MIIKSHELNKVKLLKKIYLLYGQNEGFKKEIIKKYFEEQYLNCIYRYEEKEILENKTDFFNSIMSKSFFEEKKLIIISRVSEKIKNIIEEIIEKKPQDITVILIANILEKKSKLRNFFEKNKDAICIPFYEDTFQTLSNICLKFFKDKNISISQQTVNLLIERCRGDRENLINEFDKISNYVQFGKKINSDDIGKLTNLAENYNASELADNCLAKNINKTANILNENNYSTEDCILIIRTLLIKAKRLLKLQEYINVNKNIEEAIISHKPPIFWKDKDIVKRQITQWSLEKIKCLIISISEIEFLIKKNSSSSLNILSDFILTQARK
tara:strand:+ start:51 stop:1034 length:984 start_codon:yes stop_codon:yes gene_type:complete